MDLYIFDVDGTLTDTNRIDVKCYLRAVGRHIDAERVEPDWSQFQYSTAAGITRELLEQFDVDPEDDGVHDAVRQAFRDELQRAITDGATITPVPGAADTLADLESDPSTGTAIATGDWAPSLHYKLDCAGLTIDDIPYACSDDALRRAQIIETARDRARQTHQTAFDRVTYVGDGTWDVRAAGELEIDFIGVDVQGDGERLRGAGAERVVGDLYGL